MHFISTILTTAAVASAASLQSFHLIVKGYDPAVNNSFVNPRYFEGDSYFAFTGNEDKEFVAQGDHLYFKDGDNYFSADWVELGEHKFNTLSFGPNAGGGFGFDGEGRLSVNDNQWGWFACKGSGFGGQDDHVLAYWDNQDDADKDHCTPVTIEKA